jgi:hypothetical protein
VAGDCRARRRVKLMQNPVSCDLDGSIDARVRGMLVPHLPASEQLEKRSAVVLLPIRSCLCVLGLTSTRSFSVHARSAWRWSCRRRWGR